MSYGQILRDLLEPLGVYRWEGSFQWGELQSAGAALDGVADHLASTQREMSLATAQDEGLTTFQTLLNCRTGSRDTEDLRLALAALLRISGDSFTLAAMNDTLRGCGIPAQVSETGDPLRLRVTFPDIGGRPADFDELRRIIEGVLPCHVLVEYQFTVLTWDGLEARFDHWDQVEREETTWESLEKQTL